MDTLVDFKDTEETGGLIFDKIAGKRGDGQQACTEPLQTDGQSFDK